jgi:sigma-B regulation protein RsbU (phosphoserine phosphatase)
LDEQKINLKAGDIFVLYTDGVNEAHNNRQEEFEEQRLCDVVVQNFVRNSRELISEILEHIDTFIGAQSRHDDLTMVVIKIR